MALEVFVDTSAWYEITRPSAPHHAAVTRHLRQLVEDGVGLVTTNLVVAETYALLLHRVARAPALTFVRTVGEPPNILVRSTADLEARAVDAWLAPYDDQTFSFTDAVSFAVMRDRKIDTALTLDRHFAEAGFGMVGRETG